MNTPSSIGSVNKNARIEPVKQAEEPREILRLLLQQEVLLDDTLSNLNGLVSVLGPILKVEEPCDPCAGEESLTAFGNRLKQSNYRINAINFVISDLKRRVQI